MTKVKNINGTSQNTCECGSWLSHWEKFSGQTTSYCIEKNCLNEELLGAHVQKVNSSDTNWYIIPLCKKHNSSSEEIEVLYGYKMVSANKSETCEK